MPSPQCLISAQVRKVVFKCSRFRFIKRLGALLLVIQLLFVPAPASSAAASDAIRDSGATAVGVWTSFWNWLTLSPPQAPAARGVKSPPPEKKSDKLNRLARLQINPKGAVQLQERQSMMFTAVPFDSEGSAIHGLQAEWESSDKQVVFVKESGLAKRLTRTVLRLRGNKWL